MLYGLRTKDPNVNCAREPRLKLAVPSKVYSFGDNTHMVAQKTIKNHN